MNPGRCKYDSHVDEMVEQLTTLYTFKSCPADRQLGLEWYEKAHQIVVEWADHHNLSIATVANIVAAISPQTEWNRNLIIAEDILSGREPSIGGAIGLNIRKAQTIWSLELSDIATEFPFGPKVQAFAQNLMGNYSVVTVDSHAAQAALDNPTLSTIDLRPRPYSVFAKAYKQAAIQMGLTPAAFQATIWVTWKRLHPAPAKRFAIRQRKLTRKVWGKRAA